MTETSQMLLLFETKDSFLDDVKQNCTANWPRSVVRKHLSSKNNCKMIYMSTPQHFQDSSVPFHRPESQIPKKSETLLKRITVNNICTQRACTLHCIIYMCNMTRSCNSKYSRSLLNLPPLNSLRFIKSTAELSTKSNTLGTFKQSCAITKVKQCNLWPTHCGRLAST